MTNTTLNDVVVIGYGTVKKKDLTGSVSSIGSKEIAKVPVSNVSEAMTGKLAGVNITTTEGSPDADMQDSRAWWRFSVTGQLSSLHR